MLLSSQFPIVFEFVRFLQEKTPVKVINRDQWQSFLEFASSDLSNYDESSACKFRIASEWNKILIICIANQGQSYLMSLLNGKESSYNNNNKD
jgi:hypothetical protein